jgi:hypothetical protein
VEIIVKADHKKKRKETLFKFLVDVVTDALFACADNALQKNTPHGKTNEIRMKQSQIRVKKCINSSFPAG